MSKSLPKVTLPINVIFEFKKWLVLHGWHLETPKGKEGLRARHEDYKNKAPLSVYHNKKLEQRGFFSVNTDYKDIVDAFMKEYSAEKTNAEIIRSMSDDELADFLIKYRENPCYVICPLFERQWNVCFLDCKAEVKKWLNAKAKE